MNKDELKKESVAIVGIGCRFPAGINTPEQFWSFLTSAGDAITEVPKDRWDVDAYYSENPQAPGKTYTRHGGFLQNIDQFDPGFFGISPREAAYIDPQQRLLLELTHEAMEDAGLSKDNPLARNTGVFVGIFIHDYQHVQLRERNRLSAHTGTGIAMSLAANRVSYSFDFRGPSVAMDTACSSSLVAIDQACKALLNGDCDYALAGGVNVIISPENTIAMSKATMLSKDGRSKAFDASANGYVRSEGAGLVLLQRMSDVKKTGNKVYARILGTGVNSDGKTKGISVPNGDAQETLIRRVLKESGVDASSIGYVEAHGTGTPVGDPIEANALGRVFSEGRQDDEHCLLGSVKTNIGHLESASGVAGLIKAALSLQHKIIPQNLHFTQPNPNIDFATLKLKVVTEITPWEAGLTPRRAALNSFGFGGTNAHAILEEVCEGPRSTAPLPFDANKRYPYILPFGAHDSVALQQLAGVYAEQLSKQPLETENLLYTISQRRSHGNHRAAVIEDSVEDLIGSLKTMSENESNPSVYTGIKSETFSEKPVFVYSGMGTQWWGMGRDFLKNEPVFRHAVNEIDAIFYELSGFSIVEKLLADEYESEIHKTQIAQPAIFSIQVGLTALYRHWGIQPVATIGHSVGAIAALHASGILTLKDAVYVAFHRSRLQATTAGLGRMLAAELSVSDALDVLEGIEDQVSIAAINSPTALTFSGDESCLLSLHERLLKADIFSKMLNVEVPYHSAKMDVIQAPLANVLKSLKPQKSKCTYYSTADGACVQKGEIHQGAGDADYWWRNIRQPVLFSKSIANAMQDGHHSFLEIGAHPVLQGYIKQQFQSHNIHGSVVPTLIRGSNDTGAFVKSLAQLHIAGVSIDWGCRYPQGQLITLPLYPWQRQKHWAETDQAHASRTGSANGSAFSLGLPENTPEPSWKKNISLIDQRYLADHKIQGAVVFPGTGYLEMALQTLNQSSDALGEGTHCLMLQDVEIDRALYLTEESTLQTTRQQQRWEIHSQNEEGQWVRHARGKARVAEITRELSVLNVEAIAERCNWDISTDYAYRLFKDVGLDYGPAFQGIQNLRYGNGEALAQLEFPEALLQDNANAKNEYLFHPALLDACLHTLFGALNLNGEDSHRRGNVFLPVSFKQLKLYKKPTAKVWSHARIVHRSAQHFDADISIYSDLGELIAEVYSLRCQGLEHPSEVALQRQREWLLEYHWEPSPHAFEKKDLSGQRWVVFLQQDQPDLMSSLRQAGAECIVVTLHQPFTYHGQTYHLNLSDSSDWELLFTLLQNEKNPLAGFLHASCLASSESSLNPTDWEAQLLGAGSLLMACKALGNLKQQAEEHSDDHSFWSQIRLCVLTTQTQPVVPDDTIQLAHSSIWGLHRVIANEYPYLNSQVIDVDMHDADLNGVVDILTNAAAEDEWAIRDGATYVHRLKRYMPTAPSAQPEANVENIATTENHDRIELAVPKLGDLNSMVWTRLAEFTLQAFDVEIEVEATALNFKDVMKATGLFPPRLVEGNLWSTDTLGMECAGRVSRIGCSVTNVKVGDSVMALAPRTFASHALTHCHLVALNPALSPEQAAAIPVAYLTASVALEHLAQLRANEKVLIHAGSGGVGQAAIALATLLGAEVYATVSNDEKRRIVTALGVKHIFDSRSLSFAEDIMAATDGQGVDVILNSLAGEAIAQGVSILSDYGRFIEIGKMDLDKDFQLGLRPFTRCLSFHAVDLDRLLAQKVALCGELFNRIAQRIADHQLMPLPITCFSTQEVSKAYQCMAGARHTGKLIVKMNPQSVKVKPLNGVDFSAQKSYVISGGLGGFGLQLALWMAKKGAGNLVLLGRRGAQTPGAVEAINKLNVLGANVQVMACDVADESQVCECINAINPAFALDGVFHAAATLYDALIKNLDLDRYQKTYGPKVVGAWHLHCATLNKPIRYFMCFSSMASVLGNQGSGNYCAANAVVDGLAHYRRAIGLPALTVNWGVIADVGMAADEDFYRQNLERNGLKTIHSDHCLEMLDVLLLQNRTQTTVCPIDFDTWLRFNPAGAEGRLLSLTRTAGRLSNALRSQSAEEIALRQQLDELDPAERIAHAQKRLQGLLSEIFRTDAEKIEPANTLTALGADSLMAIEIKNRLEVLGLALSVTQLLNRNSVSTLATQLLENLGYVSAKENNDERSQAHDKNTQAKPAWFICNNPKPEAKMRLFCFPYAGGGPSVYTRWSDLLPDWIELVCVSLPGRGVRGDEPNIKSIHHAADHMMADIMPLLDKPYALFGHCMGAILMYEVAHRLEQQQKPAMQIFASGCMAPHLYNSPIVHEQPDDHFLNVLRLISFSGTKALIEDKELRQSTFPLLRGDFKAVVEYGPAYVEHPPLTAPICGVAAANDLFAAPKAMEAWSSYSTKPYELAQLPGDHYFVESDRATVTDLVVAKLSGRIGMPTKPLPKSVSWITPKLSGPNVPLAPSKSELNQWNDRWRTAINQRGLTLPMQVICLPPAGLNAEDIDYGRMSNGRVNYRAIDWRLEQSDKPLNAVSDMADRLFATLKRDLNQPTILFGHCLGAAVAYELVLRMQRAGLNPPLHLLVAGVVAPHLYVAPNAHQLPDEKLIELMHVVRYPYAQQLTDSEPVKKQRMSVIRDDLQAMATYQYRPSTPLYCPITAISLRHDLWSYPLRTDSWREHTTNECTVVEWAGDHYEPMHHIERIHQLVVQLQASLSEKIDKNNKAVEPIV